ncbi:hypothetical protein N473_17795 [Pseudoalteromonas luteoviolacea CPMOR-1]|uniref:Fatty acid desaturase domain-containing protein n=1 Tax=Pseudoalteromonas luteoviolacea CPMOR-1 TaxID=1365248 RepID=A0A162AXG2_9GAMM|nr:fatty acid desaturase [Pseudoalteromonas luteoviolacea]KZN63282.1 hypothetical protein N473_17795 [Pseudoalteromonas luteoviolacea CPMOR-1]
MQTQQDVKKIIPSDQLKVYRKRSDTESSIRFSIHLTLFISLFTFLIFYRDNTALLIVCSIALGGVWAGFLAPFHECIHKTAFKSKALNQYAAWISGILFGMSPSIYKFLHFQHHRYTHVINKDPEIWGDGQFTETGATKFKFWLKLLVGKSLLISKFKQLIIFSFKSYENRKKSMGWIIESNDKDYIRESRIILSIWMVFLTFSFAFFSQMAFVVLSLVFFHVFCSFWLATEHFGLPNEGTVIEKTRTIYTNKIISFFLWNMNYHVEHHLYPDIPWYKLRTINKEIKPHIKNKSNGYIKFHIKFLTK